MVTVLTDFGEETPAAGIVTQVNSMTLNVHREPMMARRSRHWNLRVERLWREGQ